MLNYHRRFGIKARLNTLIITSLILTLTNCSSLIQNNNSTGGKIRIPDAVVVRGNTPTWSEYNALVNHANELARAVEMQQCYKHQAERESKCAWQRVDELESSWLPGRLVTGTKCNIDKIKCEVK